MNKEIKKLSEEDKFKIHVDPKTIEDPNKTKKLVALGKKNPNVEFDLEHPAIQKSSSSSSTSMVGMMEQDEAIIKPQDKATIKYLSNVKDEKTGEISKPFTIGGKNYQMVRGVTPEKNIVLGVYCLDDMGEDGENIIHPLDYFEENIIKPMSENVGMVGQDIQVADNYQGFKHFYVNRQTNEVRKFKTIEELLSHNKLDEEEYMGVGGLKKYMNEKLFGSRKKNEEFLSEVAPTGEENDEEMNIKAKKLMAMINKRIPQNIIKTIKTPVAQREVIAAFAELIGVPRVGLGNLISGLRDISNPNQNKTSEPISEKKIITKKSLEESINKKRTIKVIKAKDFLNE